MIKDNLLDLISGVNQKPNKFTIGIGKLIRSAREETGYSQRNLAELIYRRQAALSDIENGKMEPEATTLLLLSVILNKPINYFFPEPWKPIYENAQLSKKENELLLLAKQLNDDDLKRIIVQLRALADLNTK